MFQRCISTLPTNVATYTCVLPQFRESLRVTQTVVAHTANEFEKLCLTASNSCMCNFFIVPRLLLCKVGTWFPPYGIQLTLEITFCWILASLLLLLVLHSTVNLGPSMIALWWSQSCVFYPQFLTSIIFRSSSIESNHLIPGLPTRRVPSSYGELTLCKGSAPAF
jgi:hypothetical protein